jgi:hypothetical protein
MSPVLADLSFHRVLTPEYNINIAVRSTMARGKRLYTELKRPPSKHQ